MHLNVDRGFRLSDFLSSSKLESESRSVTSDSLPPHGLYRPWNYPGQNTGVGSHSPLRGSSQPGIEPGFPALQVDSLPTELSGKP